MAGGMMIAMAHDYRFTIPEKNFLCLNEIDMGARFTPGMDQVMSSKMSSQGYRELLYTGKRMSPQEALSFKIVDGIYSLDEINAKVHEFAENISEKSRFKKNFQILKMQLHEQAMRACYDRSLFPHEMDVSVCAN